MTEERVFELTTIERMMVFACGCGDFMIMGSAFVESEQNESLLDESLVRKALVILQKRHPFFRAYLDVRRKENKIFLKINNDDVTDKIKIEWLDLTSEEVNRTRLIDESAKFDSVIFDLENKNLLWKVQVISYKENGKLKYLINLVIHVAITDGFNTMTLSIELMNVINALLANQECDEMKEQLEPIEDLYVLSKKYGLFKDEHMEKIREINNIINSKKVKFNLDDMFKNGESGFILDLFSLDKDLSDRMQSAAKLNKCRLTGYFYTAALYSMRKLYIENGLEFPRRVLIDIPASLRIRYKPQLSYSHGRPHTTMVVFATDEQKFGEYKDFWSDAYCIHNQIEENTSSETGTLFSVSHSEQLDEFNQVFAQTDTNEEALKILSSENESDFAVSNLGRYVNDNVKVFPGAFEIKELYCTDPINTNPSISPAIVIHLFFWRGQIMVEYGANKSSFSTSYFKRYKEILLETIHSTAN